jgi:hypothetical protein
MKDLSAKILNDEPGATTGTSQGSFEGKIYYA